MGATWSSARYECRRLLHVPAFLFLRLTRMSLSSLSLAHQVVEGMDVVKQVEALGSQSGAPQAKIQIVKSGEIAL